MKTLTVSLPRYAPMHGWTGRLLRVDLSDGRIWAQETAHMFPDLLGGRGVAAKILWDEYPEPVDAFDPRNPFMVMPGALTGSRSPYSGRTVVCAFSPQSLSLQLVHARQHRPRFGAELKKAGYDGLVVTGASDTPVQILIRDDEVSILPADELWGLDTFETQEALSAGARQAGQDADHRPGGRAPVPHRHRADRHYLCGRAGWLWRGDGLQKAQGHLGDRHRRVPRRRPGAPPVALSRRGRRGARSLRGRRSRLDALNEQLQSEGGGRARVYALHRLLPHPLQPVHDDMPGVRLPTASGRAAWPA